MTKKTKILTIFLSVLAGITLLVVLSSTLFSVGEIKLEFKSQKIVLSEVSETEIISSSGLKKGTSVFLIDKTSMSKNLEKTYPYLKVLSIETKFPNKVIINAIERDEVFAFQQSEKYIITDSDLKVLKIVSGDYVSNNENAIKVLDFDDCDVEVGQFLTPKQKFLTLKTIEDNNYQNYAKEESQNALQDLLATYKMVTVFDDKVLFGSFFGVKIQIFAVDIRGQEKLKMATAVFDGLTIEQKQKGIISVFQKDGKVLGSYKDE